mgnify:CR=1 FL=1
MLDLFPGAPAVLSELCFILCWVVPAITPFIAASGWMFSARRATRNAPRTPLSPPCCLTEIKKPGFSAFGRYRLY